MTKVVIFTDIGLFSIPKAVGDYLILNKRWKLVEDLPYKLNQVEKVFIVHDYPDDDSYYYTIHMFDKIFRCHDDIIEAYSSLNSDEYKIIDIPDDIEWYIDEADDGSESIHEKHRIWS